MTMSYSSASICALKVSVLVFSCVAFGNAQNEYRTETTISNPCKTLNEQCVDIDYCPWMINILTEKIKVEDSVANMLRKLHCGWANTRPKVCCENETMPEIPKSDTNLIKYTGINLFPNKTICGDVGFPMNKILGGEVAGIDEFPWLALLSVAKGNTHRYHCCGSLINDRYVITAAHCVYNQNLKDVRLGEWDLSTDKDCLIDDKFPDQTVCNDPPVDVAIARAIVHPNYNRENNANDIALLRLAEQIKYTYWIRPICMPFSSKLRNKEFKNEKLTISGWGKTETRQKSLKKLKVKLPVEDFEICSAKFMLAKVMLTNRQMCAGGESGKDSCSGDSGGPLMSLVTEEKSEKWYIAGITSYGPQTCATLGWPGVYTRIGSYVDWIISQVEQ